MNDREPITRQNIRIGLKIVQQVVYDAFIALQHSEMNGQIASVRLAIIYQLFFPVLINNEKLGEIFENLLCSVVRGGLKNIQVVLKSHAKKILSREVETMEFL